MGSYREAHAPTGTPTRSPYGIAVMDFMIEHEEAPRLELVAHLAGLVPPAKAVRKHKVLLRGSRNQREKINTGERKGNLRSFSVEHQVLYGSNAKARELVYKFIMFGFLAHDKERDVITKGPDWKRFEAGYTKKKEAANGKG